MTPDSISRGAAGRSALPTDPAARRMVCYLSRRHGWIDPSRPGRPTYEVNLLAVALQSRVFTLGTAWESIFHAPMPRSVLAAFRKAMVRVPVSEEDVRLLRGVADQLHVELVVRE